MRCQICCILMLSVSGYRVVSGDEKNESAANTSSDFLKIGFSVNEFITVLFSGRARTKESLKVEAKFCYPEQFSS